MTSTLTLTTSLKLTMTATWRRWVSTQRQKRSLEAPVAMKVLLALEALVATEDAHAPKVNLGLKCADVQEQQIACVQKMDVLATERRQTYRAHQRVTLRVSLRLVQKMIAPGVMLVWNALIGIRHKLTLTLKTAHARLR